jgi:hypothetical protein
MLHTNIAGELKPGNDGKAHRGGQVTVVRLKPGKCTNGRSKKAPASPAISAHPLAAAAGAFADEPLWDEFQAAIERYRRSIEEE